MKKGIYLVANFRSQDICENLIFSIRESGCALPIRVIHFGGKEVCSSYILSQAELLHFENFPENAKRFITRLRSVLTDCPLGFLYRFLPWFSDWDEFIYSDNDIVAMCNWEELFPYLKGYDLIHADQEYLTGGIFNYNEPQKVEEFFGKGALQSAITAGHIVVKKNLQMIEDMSNAMVWFEQNPSVAKKHDQSMLHIASLLGQWKVLNLCKPPHSWLSSWSGDYKNALNLILKSQSGNLKISHIHYSGFKPKGDHPMQEFLFSSSKPKERLRKLFMLAFQKFSGFEFVNFQKQRALGKIQLITKKRPIA